jgi:hypothetical protein
LSPKGKAIVSNNIKRRKKEKDRKKVKKTKKKEKRRKKRKKTAKLSTGNPFFKKQTMFFKFIRLFFVFKGV